MLWNRCSPKRRVPHGPTRRARCWADLRADRHVDEALYLEAAREARSRVNQEPFHSTKMAIVVGLCCGLSVGFGIGLSDRLTHGFIMAVLVGLLCGLFSGGMFVLKHFVLRLFFYTSRSAPLRYITFLTEAKELFFLRQVGGGYVFVHGLLHEYFVGLFNDSESERP